MCRVYTKCILESYNSNSLTFVIKEIKSHLQEDLGSCSWGSTALQKLYIARETENIEEVET